MKNILLLCVFAFLCALNSLAQSRPLVDHHTHIWSINASRLLTAPVLPAIILPEDLTLLLRAREQGWNNKAALLDLYTEDALMLNSRGEKSDWIRGRDLVSEKVSETFGRPYQITPVSYQTNGAIGFVAGYFARPDSDILKPFGKVSLSLKKSSDEKWRISSETLSFPGPSVAQAITAEDLIKYMDSEGIKRSVVLSVGYWFGSRSSPKGDADEYAKVRTENDWAAEQVARYPDRLIAFCSFNPLKDYATDELNRCAKSDRFKGLKLHFGMSEVDLLNPEHVRKVRLIFAEANKLRLPILIHVRGDLKVYGREQAEVFVNQLLPAAPDVVIQIAHLWGGEGVSEPALEVYANAVNNKNPATKNLYFDVTEIELVLEGQDIVMKNRIVSLMRQIGFQRILYGSDGPRNEGDALSRRAWTAFKTFMPLTEEEFRTIAGNIAPYLR